MSYCLNGHRCKVFWHWTSFILRNSPYMSYSMGAPTLLPPGLTLPRYPSVSTTPVPTYQVSSSPAWLPQYIMQPQMPHVSDFVFVLLKLWKIVVFLLTSVRVCVVVHVYSMCMHVHACMCSQQSSCDFCPSLLQNVAFTRYRDKCVFVCCLNCRDLVSILFN